jgi:hypothetical protein
VRRWKPGMAVVYTAEDLGVVDSPTGTYILSIAMEMRSPRWHLTKTEINGREYFVPVHESMFEPSLSTRENH